MNVIDHVSVHSTSPGVPTDSQTAASSLSADLRRITFYARRVAKYKHLTEEARSRLQLLAAEAEAIEQAVKFG